MFMKELGFSYNQENEGEEINMVSLLGCERILLIYSIVEGVEKRKVWGEKKSGRLGQVKR